MMKPKIPTTLLISLGCVVVAGLAVGSLLESRSDPLRQLGAEETEEAQSPAARAQQLGRGLSSPWPWGDSPVAFGQRVPLEVATTFLRTCLCPLLPPSGPASPEHVDNAWASPDGVVVLEFDNGIKLAAAPDTELTASTWISAAQENIALIGAGRMVIVRDTQGLAYDIDDTNPESVPSVKWVEGHALITVAGHGPQAVDDLIVFADQLANPQVPE
jgi:hypothetical protein